MEVLEIELTNNKAYPLLQDMEKKKLIKVLKKDPNRISTLRKKIKTPMSKERIEYQLNSMRKEWKRSF